MDVNASAVRLSREYDVDRLRQDLDSCVRFYDRWVTHAQVLEGRSTGWNVLPLRSRAGDVTDACARTQRPEPFRDTILLEHTPYVREIIEGLDSAVSSVRFSSLHAGGHIYEHSDGEGFGLGDGPEIRLHLPIITSDDVWFVVDKVRYPLRAGELWYGDFTKLHWVENRGAEPRVHLMIDTRVSETVLGLFPPEYLEGRSVKADPPRGAAPPAEMLALEPFTVQLGGMGDELARAIANLPPGFQDVLQATFGQRNEIRWIDGKLWGVVRGHPAFQLEIESARRLRVAYQPAAIELDLEDGRPVRGSLELTIFGQEFRLPLQVGPLA